MGDETETIFKFFKFTIGESVVVRRVRVIFFKKTFEIYDVGRSRVYFSGRSTSEAC